MASLKWNRVVVCTIIVAIRTVVVMVLLLLLVLSRIEWKLLLLLPLVLLLLMIQVAIGAGGGTRKVNTLIIELICHQEHRSVRDTARKSEQRSKLRGRMSNRLGNKSLEGGGLDQMRKRPQKEEDSTAGVRARGVVRDIVMTLMMMVRMMPRRRAIVIAVVVVATATVCWKRRRMPKCGARGLMILNERRAAIRQLALMRGCSSCSTSAM